MKKFIAGLLLFAVFFSIGMLLARHKPLWVDELFAQQATIQQISWPNLILGHIPEGNKFPLYLIFHKALLQLIHYRLPFVWNGEAMVVNLKGQLILRILPDALMSAALTAIVLFFGFRSGFAAGAMAALICLSTPMVWLYWAEARYYPLWFLLTAWQSLLFLESVSKKEIKAPILPLMIVHTGLCLTAPTGMVQTIMCLGLWRLAGVKRMGFYIFTGFIPLLLGIYYTALQKGVGMYFLVSQQQIFLRNFPVEEIIFLGLYILLFLLTLRDEDFHPYFSAGRAFFPFCLASIIIAFAGFFYIAHQSSLPKTAIVVERHFIFLTPVGIIMTAAIFSDLWKACTKRLWWQLGVLIIFGAGLLAQALSAFDIVYSNGFY